MYMIGLHIVSFGLGVLEGDHLLSREKQNENHRPKARLCL